MTNSRKALALGLLIFAADGSAKPPAAAPAQTTVELFSRRLQFTLPPAMERVTNRANGTNVLIEYVPRGETLANWTRLVTIQADRGLGSSAYPTAVIARQAFFPAACRVGPIYRDLGERAQSAGLRRTVVVNGCASLPAGAYPKVLRGAGEPDFILIFRDAETVYTLNYAVRGAPFATQSPPIDVGSAEAVLRQQFGLVTLNAAGN